MATNMASGGVTVALACDRAYDFGRAMAVSAALAILGKKAPEFGIVEAVTVTKSTLTDGYSAWDQQLPKAVKDALG
jgi:ribose transport system substrate-binding protein